VATSKLLKYGAGDGGRTRDVQLGKTTINWKQRQLRFLHLFLAIENNPVFTLGFGSVLNGAQTEHGIDLARMPSPVAIE